MEHIRTISREDIYREIDQERDRQELKFGEQNHEPMIWLPILMEEVGEASKAALEAHFKGKKGISARLSYDDYREELIQVIAVGINMLECLDRNQRKE